MRSEKAKLDPNRHSFESQEFESAMRRRIVGQEEGVRALVDLYQVFRAGMSSSGRPVGNLLFLGPTGSGKTRIVEAAAEILFGDPRAVIKVDCAEFQHSHEIAKLIGSPPGYLGHRETHPLITQEALATYHKEDLKLSFLLFDEIEKASDALWQLLLGILDKATLTLGDNRRVDLSQTMIFLTSNLGGGEITELMTGGMGFVQPQDKAEDRFDHKIEQTAQLAAKKKFSPEFMNRLDKVVVFHPLRHWWSTRWRICWLPSRSASVTCSSWIGMERPTAWRSTGKGRAPQSLHRHAAAFASPPRSPSPRQREKRRSTSECVSRNRFCRGRFE
jgi:ATP-dependent Clp protease ATP-binding subunit ClpA